MTPPTLHHIKYFNKHIVLPLGEYVLIHRLIHNHPMILYSMSILLAPLCDRSCQPRIFLCVHVVGDHFSIIFFSRLIQTKTGVSEAVSIERRMLSLVLFHLITLPFLPLRGEENPQEF